MGISIKRWMAAAAWMAAGPALAAPTYIHADRVIAVPGQPVRGASTIIVDAGRIVSIQNGHLAPPSGATAIDLRGKTVLPGLIDSHVHLSSDRGGEAGLLSFVREEPQMNALEAQMNGMKTLRAGFTTVRNLGDEGATLALARSDQARVGAGAADRRRREQHFDHRRPYGRTRWAQRRPRRASAQPGESLRRCRRLPQGRPPADRPRRRRDQVRDHRRGEQRDRPRHANVRGRGARRWSRPPMPMAARSRSTPMAPTASSSRSVPGPIRSSMGP